MKLKIERGVPMPKLRIKVREGHTAAIYEMKVGDSFEVPNEEKAITAIYNAIKVIRIYHGLKNRQFKSKTQPNGKRRFWRIK